MAQIISPLAGKPAPRSSLVDIASSSARTTAASPIRRLPAQRVAFGTSGHRGTAFDGTSTRRTSLAITQAICDYRAQQGHRRPAVHRHRHARAVASPRCASALEVLAANGVDTMISRWTTSTRRRLRSRTRSYAQPRPHARGWPTASSSRRRTIRPTTAASSTTRPTAARPTTDITSAIAGRGQRATSEKNLRGVKRMPFAQALARTRPRIATITSARYVADLGNVIDLDAIRDARLRIGVDPLGGAGVHYWAPHRRALPARPDRRQRRRRPHLPLHDARLGRQDPHGPVVAVRDAAADRH